MPCHRIAAIIHATTAASLAQAATVPLAGSKLWLMRRIAAVAHRAIKRRVRPMMGFKTFHTARRLIAGIETMHMIHKGQLSCPNGSLTPAAQQFYSLAI